MIRRFAAGAAIGTAVVLSATGCLGDGGKASGGDKASGTSGQGTARLTAAEAVSKASQTTGEIRTFEGTITSDTGVAGQQAHTAGRVSFRAKPTIAFKMTATSMTVNGRSQGGFQEILLGTMMYMKVPALRARTGKPWMRLNLQKLAGKEGIDYSSLTRQSQQTDPSANLKMLTASKDVRQVGRETVGGISTTHYQGTYPIQAALAKLSADQRAKMQKLMAQMGFDKMSFDLWVDDQNLPRKMTLRSPAGAKVMTNTTMTYTRFNVPVSITAPPASQVASAG